MNHKENTRVLVLDEEENLTFLLSTVLEFNRYGVTITKKPEEAKKALEKGQYDLFITDYKLADGNGMEVIKDVRHGMSLMEMKIILLTFRELGDRELRELAKENVTYVKKPFLPNEFISIIENLFV